jgi:RNA polymerase sigma-70 factor (ECF subfamily)
MAFVYAVVNGKLSTFSRQDVEECVSDIFYEIYRTRDRIDLERGSLKSYIAVVANRRAINTFKKLCGKNIHISLEDYEHEWLSDDSDMESNLIKSETRETLLKEIEALGEPDNQIMIRKYYWGYTSKTISEELGMKEVTVKKRAERALIKLRKALGEEMLGGVF